MNTEILSLTDRIKELEKENITLKQQQIEITEAKELYLKIFEEFPALIWRSRLDKLCDYFNKTWLDFTGRTMEQEFGNGWAEGVHPDDFNSCLQTYVTAFDKREPFLMEYRMKNKFGNYCWIRDFGRPFYDLDNTFLGYIGSCYDITENKNIELELIELNTTKDKFFSIIAHDLKSPFNSVIGLSNHLVENIKKNNIEGIDTYGNLIIKSANKAMDLLMNLMEWSRSQTGRMEFNPEYIDLVACTVKIIHLYDDIAGQKSIIIKSILPQNVFVFADVAMISTVVRNLLSNAIKFTMPGGEIIVSIKVDKSGIIFSVSDSGVGIAKHNIEKLFRIDQSYSTPGTNKETGTGLGLILCKDFVEKHSGRIWVESEERKGTTLYFTLPDSTRTQEKKVIENAVPAATENHINTAVSGLKILIAEDDEASEMLLDIEVKKYCREILKVTTGIAAVQACRDNPDTDLILMDIEMPEMNGYNATRQIRQFNQDVVIIAQTGYGLSGDREKSIAAGCNDYISKPINRDELLSLIQKYFEK